MRRMLDSMTKKQGLKYDSPSSVKDIEPFIRFHNLNLVRPMSFDCPPGPRLIRTPP